jgi:uncharacterized membrane protein YGL010W
VNASDVTHESGMPVNRRPRGARKTADACFAEYAANHQHHTNELIHWICVPVIFACVLGFTWIIPVPESWTAAVPWFNWTLPAILFATVFYVRLSPRLSAGMLFFMALCYTGLVLLDTASGWPVGKICTIAFLLAWAGQFIGHKIEGRKPTFLKGLVFLLIGPAWLMSRLYRKIGQVY